MDPGLTKRVKFLINLMSFSVLCLKKFLSNTKTLFLLFVSIVLKVNPKDRPLWKKWFHVI